VGAVGIFHNKFAAFVGIWRREKERRGQIGPDAMRRTSNLANRVINVRSECLPAFVAIEQRRENLRGKRRPHEQRMAFESNQNAGSELARHRVVFGQLQIVFDAAGLWAGGHSTIDPLGPLKQLEYIGCFLGGKDSVYV
jgi:hypothetical protein